ncbi:MAG: DUF971 domain-containing protein [Planctomycetota bacterium]
MSTSTLRPVSLAKEGDDFLVITWSDGVRHRLRWTDLRRDCPCAGCNEEREQPPDPFRILKPSELVPLKPLKIEPIGFYAYRITWSDGHDTGLYTLENLRAMGERAIGIKS